MNTQDSGIGNAQQPFARPFCSALSDALKAAGTLAIASRKPQLAAEFVKLARDVIPHAGENPPAAKKGWDHSEMVLVYYAADPEMDHTSAWSIAYYHHKPPFNEKPGWVDFSRSWGTPDYWWPLPELPNDGTHAPRKENL